MKLFTRVWKSLSVIPSEKICAVRLVFMLSLSLLKPGYTNLGLRLILGGFSELSPRNLASAPMLTSTVSYRKDRVSPRGTGLILSQCAGISLVST